MKKIFLKLIIGLLPLRRWRKFFRNKMNHHSTKMLKNDDFNLVKVYDEPFYPFYNIYAKLSNKEPILYNKNGEIVRSIFIRDKTCSSDNGQRGHYILWDKYNFGLDNHFYSHDYISKTIGSPKKKFAALIETKGIDPESYLIFDKNKGLAEQFDLIFTYDADILQKYVNSRFVPFCAGVRLDFANSHDLEISRKLVKNDLFKTKNKNISILSSDKEMCELHKLRKKIAIRFKNDKLVDTFGTFDGGGYTKAIDTLENYRFSIIFENEISDYCFTEKLTNCFAMQTIPIYIGAKKIKDFFNINGIIQINLTEINDIEQILKTCTKEFYEERLEYILDNYQRVLKDYMNVEDNFLYKKYLKDIL